MIKGYNIYFLTDLEELNKKIYTETVFDQIWYIRSGLTHADLIKVAEKYANQKILQARDWKAVAVLQIARTENCTMMEVVKSIINFRERGGNYGEIKQVRIL